MASGLMKLVLSLTGRDDGAKRLLAETERQLQRTATSRMQMARAHKPYEIVGIRSEKAIQREIKLTEAAYNRLKRSGTASQNDLARAAQAHKQKLKELNAELGRGAGLQKGMAAGAAVFAGGAAAYGVLKPAMDNQKQLDANITQVAWQAYGEDNSKSADWIAKEGKGEIRALVKELVDTNGGTADAALQLINSMMANGMSFEQARANAQSSHRAMLASAEGVGQYNPQDTAKLFKVLSDFGFKGDELSKAFEYAMKSGMQGNFEIADMVRELPALLPAAKAAGMDGLQGFGFLLSTLQSAANKAGSNSEAANNVRNLLEKTLSADTTKRLSKMVNPQQPGKGIDWRASVLKGKENGESAVQVLARLADSMLEKDSEYQAFKKKADAGDETAKSQMNIMKGFVLSSILPDIQAKGGLLAAADTQQVQEYMQGLLGLNPQNSLVDKKLAVMESSAAYKQEQAEAKALLGQDALTEPLIKAETGLKSLTAEFPNATLALQTLAAAAMAAVAAQGLMGVLGGGGLGGGAAAVGTAARFGLVGIGAAAGGLGLWDANSRINRNEGKGFTEGGLNSRAAGYAESALSGAALGAAVGSIIPGIGTAIGAAIGAGGGLLTAAITDAWKENPPPKPAGMAAEPLQPLRPLEPLKPAEPLAPVITQQTAAYQAAITQQTAAYQAALNEDTAAVTGGLNQINSTLAAANQTINNNMTVTLDGRVIAQEVSRYQVAMFGRGAGQ